MNNPYVLHKPMLVDSGCKAFCNCDPKKCKDCQSKEMAHMLYTAGALRPSDLMKIDADYLDA